jgi:hypothetical protein
VLLAEGEVVEADGLALPLAVVPVPGALSLIAPPVGEVELVVLLPAGAVVVVVVVVAAVVEPEPIVDEVALAACQSPWTFTECPT